MDSSATWQASSFIKLALGVALRYDLPHAITADDEGSPAYRAVISGEGNRLEVRDSFLVTIAARAAVSF